jgi:hypothetical protein
MKKFYLALILFLFISLTGTSQTATSVMNGNWTNPLTWNCTCVPSNGYSVTINHTVTLNTPLLFGTGGITINSAGALIQDATPRDIWINGGYMYNSGKALFRYFLVSAGTASNAGSYSLSAFTNSVSYLNSGSITMDSMYIAGTFTNATNGKISGDSLTNASTLINNGNINVTWVLNNNTFKNYNYQGGYAYTNASVYENYDSLILSGSVWNKSLFFNKPNSRVNLTKNFHNYNPSTTAVFDNDGIVRAFDSWYNTDTVKGSGQFIVSDTSANSGFMKENFDFCDLTPPATTPKVDLNSGTISTGITWCITGTGVSEHSAVSSLQVYPNPNSGVFFIRSNTEEHLVITDQLGRNVKNIDLTKKNDYSIVVDDLDYGIYFVSGNGSAIRIVVMK